MRKTSQPESPGQRVLKRFPDRRVGVPIVDGVVANRFLASCALKPFEVIEKGRASLKRDVRVSTPVGVASDGQINAGGRELMGCLSHPFGEEVADYSSQDRIGIQSASWLRRGR